MKSPRSYLINRDYANLWYGHAVSTVGDYVFDTTVTLWVATVIAKGAPWAPAAVSCVVLSVGAAILVVGPLAGVFVDRWHRKKTMLRSEVVRGCLVAVLAVLSVVPTRDLPVWLWLTVIYVVVFALNVAKQFFQPARFATIGEVVAGDANRARAAGIGQATTALAAIVGPDVWRGGCRELQPVATHTKSHAGWGCLASRKTDPKPQYSGRSTMARGQSHGLGFGSGSIIDYGNGDIEYRQTGKNASSLQDQHCGHNGLLRSQGDKARQEEWRERLAASVGPAGQRDRTRSLPDQPRHRSEDRSVGSGTSVVSRERAAERASGDAAGHGTGHYRG